MEKLVLASVFLAMRRQKEANKLEAERGGLWFWCGEESKDSGIKIGGVSVPNRDQATEIRLRLLVEGIIAESTTVPMIVDGEPVDAIFFRQGPNFYSNPDRFYQVIQTVTAKPEQRGTLLQFRGNEPVIS